MLRPISRIQTHSYIYTRTNYHECPSQTRGRQEETWGGRYGCNNGRYGCTIVMSYIEINKAVSQWLLTFNLCVSITWPLTCAFHIPCTHTPEIIDMHRGVCDNTQHYVPLTQLCLYVYVKLFKIGSGNGFTTFQNIGYKRLTSFSWLQSVCHKYLSFPSSVWFMHLC